MSELLNALFYALVPLCKMSLTAAYVAAVVVILRLMLKKHAPKQVICLLWLVVFARLLVPVSLESPLSIVPDTPAARLTESLPDQPEGEGVAEPVQPPVQEHEPAQDLNPTQSGAVTAAPVPPGNAASAAPALTVPSGVTPSVPQPKSPEPFPWHALCAGCWLAGALTMGSYGIFSYLRLRRRLFDAIRAEDGAWEHPSVGSPFILGVFRPRIYLPTGLHGQPRQFILCHERAHLKRLDHIVKPICWAALALHWFNPAVWAAFLLMSKDIESACDESVIRQLGPAVKADYSATLLSLATNGRVPAPCPLAFDEGNAKGRIKNVLSYRRPTLWVIVVSVALALAAAVCLLTDPVSTKEPDEPASDSPVPEASASQEPEQEPEPLAEPVPEPLPTVPDWAVEVLSGERQFYSVSQKKRMDLEPLNAAYGEPDRFYDLDYKLAVVDLDGDGEDEVILEPCYIGTSANESDENLLFLGYFILHAEGDQVYGYTPGYSDFTEIKVGGVYQFFAYANIPDSNAYDSGWGHVRFTDEGMEPDPILRARNRANVYPEDMDYYINGEPVDMDEYYREFERYNMLPAIFWYRWYADTGLLPAAVIADQSTYTPKFLGGGLRELYRQASYFYYHLFGENTSGICEMESASAWGSSLYDPTDTIERDGLTYVRVTGQYARWSDLMAVADALFTRNFWDACNRWDSHELFISVDGDTYFLPASRLKGDYYGAGPAPFTLVEQTEDSVTVTLTAGYNRYQAGEDEAAWGQRLERGYDYTVDYTIRYVKTEDGWRFDEFHYPQSDRREYTLGHVLWQTDPLHAVNGWMDDVTLRQAGPDTLLDWLGTTYKLEPDVNVNSFVGRMYVLDVDGDGQTEAALVYLDENNSPTIAVYERTGRGLQRVTFDTGTLVSLFDDHVTVERNPEGGLTVTHRGAKEDTAIQLSDTVFDGYEWLREGEIYVKMEPDIFYAGLFSEMPLTPPFAVNSFAYLTDGNGHGPYMAYVAFSVDYDGSRLTPGKLYLEPYSEFAVPNR